MSARPDDDRRRLAEAWRPLATLALLATGLLQAPLAGAAAPKQEPEPVLGVVTKVIDGDSLWLQPAGQAPIEVRLRDIDAPESCQPWGPEAKRALQEFALGKSAELRGRARDPYGRLLGQVRIDGQDLGARMVQEGHAWSVRTKWDNGPLVKQERQARALGRGLHATPGAVNPKVFRKTTKCPKP